MARRKKPKDNEVLSESEVAEVLDSATPSSDDINCPVESELKSAHDKKKKEMKKPELKKFDKFKK